MEEPREFQFREQYSVGLLGEAVLDLALSRFFLIAESGKELEKRGIDRILTTRSTGARVSAEYKTDLLIKKTRRMFVETKINERDGSTTLGWALKSEAQMLVYYSVYDKEAYCIDLLKMKFLLSAYKNDYPFRRVDNKSYSGEGVLVPRARVTSDKLILRTISNIPIPKRLTEETL